MEEAAGASGYREAVQALEARGFGIKPGLERMQELVLLLDNPQLTYPTIHVAGTNGKTSTCWILGAILSAHGLKTGVYTSPHLQTVRERYVLMGIEEGKPVAGMVSEEDLASLLQYLAPFVELVEKSGRLPRHSQESVQPLAEASGEEATVAAPDGVGRSEKAVSYFELTTLAAFEWMAERSVGVGVYEAGLGGSWDATNLVESSVAVLTPIGVDHRAYLGATPAANASEKAGIIKSGATVISAKQEPEVTDIIGRAAEDRQAKMMVLGRDFSISSDQLAVGGRAVSIQTPLGHYRDLFLPLHGSHQAVNLALAIAAAESFAGQALDQGSLELGLSSVRAPGRLEVLSRKPAVVLDGAHNPSAAAVLVASVRETFRGLPVTLVVSIFEDKDLPGILAHLAPLAERIVFTRSSSPRAADPRQLAAHVPSGIPQEIVEPLDEAVDQAISSTPKEGLILITGSLYAAGEARAHLQSGD